MCLPISLIQLTLQFIIVSWMANTIYKGISSASALESNGLNVQHKQVSGRDNVQLGSRNRNVQVSSTIFTNSSQLTSISANSGGTNPSYYYRTNNDPALLPRNNYDITIGNPMRGLCPSPDSISFKDWTPNLPASIGDFKWPLNKFMMNDPDVVGEELAFDWNFVESRFRAMANYSLHAVIRFYVHWPGQPFNVPGYLYNPPYNFTLINNNTEIFYENAALKKAFRQSITALANRYDGDTRLLSIQTGFTGYWGEWHTLGCKVNATTDCLPRSVNDEVIQWYKASFRTTQIQARFTDYSNAYKSGFGYFDDSFTYYTLNGTYNGGIDREADWFFWNMAVVNNVSDFWKTSLMGGEVRPENDNVFADTYPTGTEHKQEFNACVEKTHATYMGYFRGWQANGYTGTVGTELQRARYATSRMGYSFEIDTVSVATNAITSGNIDIDVVLKQTGVAPFYYPLNLTLYCNANGMKIATAPIMKSTLTDQNAITTIRFTNINTPQTCLSAVEFKLESPYLYKNRPIKWAQGSNDGRVIVSIPPKPTLAPQNKPTLAPSQLPKSVPPQKPPTGLPVNTKGWASNWYFVNVTSGNVLYNYGKIIPGGRYNFGTLGKDLSLVLETNRSIRKVKFTWPVKNTSSKVGAPFVLHGFSGNKNKKATYLSDSGFKTIHVTAYRTFSRFAFNGEITFWLD